jgi:GNAT superfamily N-acetyltransferase
MSDFYKRRRIVIKDSLALVTFFIGFVWSGAFLWPIIANEVDRGDMIRGLGYFLAAVFASGVLMGVIGLETGNLLGGVWERYHRRHRGFATSGGSPVLAWNAPSYEDAPRSGPVGVNTQLTDVSRVYYDQAGVYAASFIPLAQRVRPTQYETHKVRAALAKTTNIGAWDGARLIGVVRVLTDGYTFSAVADILVDPDYQRLGIGRTLMRHALAATPDARLLVEAQPDSVQFFERIGCDRGPTGLLLTASVVH